MKTTYTGFYYQVDVVHSNRFPLRVEVTGLGNRIIPFTGDRASDIEQRLLNGADVDELIGGMDCRNLPTR